mmetsp:Transcript_38539/g.106180  ORF Transcript_38539/g.106180 Transcript_38539/m.106180 type:complete len:373 (+) Transcript_38539:809-1927(+)
MRTNCFFPGWKNRTTYLHLAESESCRPNIACIHAGYSATPAQAHRNHKFPTAPSQITSSGSTLWKRHGSAFRSERRAQPSTRTDAFPKDFAPGGKSISTKRPSMYVASNGSSGSAPRTSFVLAPFLPFRLLGTLASGAIMLCKSPSSVVIEVDKSTTRKPGAIWTSACPISQSRSCARFNLLLGFSFAFAPRAGNDCVEVTLQTLPTPAATSPSWLLLLIAAANARHAASASSSESAPRRPIGQSSPGWNSQSSLSSFSSSSTASASPKLGQSSSSRKPVTARCRVGKLDSKRRPRDFDGDTPSQHMRLSCRPSLVSHMAQQSNGVCAYFEGLKREYVFTGSPSGGGCFEMNQPSSARPSVQPKKIALCAPL